jgi:aminoglycoside phosphotransferase (APT) family kinase protein
MLGGASRETWSFTLDGRPLVWRRDPSGAPRAGGMRREAALLRAAAAAGVPVPEVVDVDDSSIVMQRLLGETIARRILRDDVYAAARDRLTGQLAQAAAALHTRVDPDSIDGLPDEVDPLAAIRAMLDAATEPHPALELGFAWLTSRRPAGLGRVVVHGDFRLGNIVVDDAGLVGVLDWELAHVGDPAEDLGWLCVRSWRFGGRLPVAGIGSREELLAEYVAAGGPTVSAEALAWWEAFGTLRWGAICVQQAATHLTGARRSVELAAIGRRVCEVELDLCDLVVGPGSLDADPEPLADLGPHDRPVLPELIASVREWVEGLGLEGSDAFLARVAARSLRIAEREAVLGPVLAQRHAARLAVAGFSTDAEVAAAIRAGDDRPQLAALVRDAVVDKLRVADPAQLEAREVSPRSTSAAAE